MISLRSKLVRKLLNYFFINPQEKLYVNEVSKKLDLDKRNLVKKLRELEQEGILKSERRGNLKLYSVNRRYYLYKEYKSTILKTVGLEDRLRKIIQSTYGVREGYIYGSYVLGRMGIYSDVDLLVIGDHNILELQRKLNQLQKEINREINIVNMSTREFKNRIKKRDTFIQEIFNKKHIRLI